MPLYREFKSEDWLMLSLRFELYLMITAFRRDANDSERQGVPLDHLSFYYNRYYKKALSPAQFGVNDLSELVGLVDDSVFLNTQQVIEVDLPDELETFALFVKLTEEDRRYRQLRVDIGDDTFKLKVQQGSNPSAPPPSEPREKGSGA